MKMSPTNGNHGVALWAAVLLLVISSSHSAPLLTVQSSPQLVPPSQALDRAEQSRSSPPSVHVFDYQLQLTPLTYHLVSLNRSSIFASYPNASYFMVVGIHTFERNISLCHHGRLVLNSTNLGLVLLGNESASSGAQHTICLYNPSALVLRVLVVATVYPMSHPIPGGCNVEFELETSPYLRMAPHDRWLVNRLDFQRASRGGLSPTASSWRRACSAGGAAAPRYEYRVYAFSVFRRESEDDYFRMMTQMSSHEFVTSGARLAKLIEPSHLMFRLWFLANQRHRVYVNIAVVSSSASSSLNTTTLYVPNRTDFGYGGAFFQYSSPLWLLLAFLSAASALVSAVGYRNFLFEIYYFTFIFALSVNLALLAHHPNTTSWVVAGAALVVPAGALAALWTAVCRWSENLKLALSMHSLVLSTWLTLAGLELIILAVSQWQTVMLVVQDTLTANFNWILMVGTLLVHTILFYSFDLFWLSALSTSVVSVYFVLLPVDLLYGASLFRVLLNIWLYNEFQEHLAFFNLTRMSSNDVLTYLLFIFLVLLTITWQLWSKVGNGHYGFACLVQPGELAGCVGHTAYPNEQAKGNGKDKAMTMEMTSTRPPENCSKEEEGGHVGDDDDDDAQRGEGGTQPTSKGRRRKAFAAFSLACNPKTMRRAKRRMWKKKKKGGRRRKAYRCRYCNKRADSKTTTAGGAGAGAYERRGAAQHNYHYCKTTARTKHTLMTTTEANEPRRRGRGRGRPEENYDEGGRGEYEDTRTESTYIDYISRKSDGRAAAAAAAAVIEY